MYEVDLVAEEDSPEPEPVHNADELPIDPVPVTTLSDTNQEPHHA